MFHKQGGGRVRFNPNLYENGKVGLMVMINQIVGFDGEN